METIEIFDTTLRDGEQSPGAAMTACTRLKIARLLDEAGVDTIEAGFPISNEVSFESVRAIAKRTRNARVAALARCTQEDIETAAKAVAGARRPRIHVFIATSPVHLRQKLGISADDIIFDNPYWQTATQKTRGCQIDYVIQCRNNTVYACEIKFSKDPLQRAVISEVDRKIRNIAKPRNYTFRPVLIHVNGVDDSLLDERYFDNVIDFGEMWS